MTEQLITAKLTERIKARTHQLGLSTQGVAERAGVNRSFLYDILRGRSLNPSQEKLAKVAAALKVDPGWLLTGNGEVEGVEPATIPDDYVSIVSVRVVASMGGGRVVDDMVETGKPFHFLRSWVSGTLKASPNDLRIMKVAGDSMEPTLKDEDTVLVDLAQKTPTPPGIFILFDGMGLVAKRLELLPSGNPPRLRIASDNPMYAPYEVTTDEVTVIGRIRWFAREV